MSRKVETFVPLDENRVRMYSCGPTVYDYQHIGNMRTYVMNDTLKRVLLYNGYKVLHVMNITDVGHLTSDADTGEDKMMKALKRENLPATKASMLKLAKKYQEHFQGDLDKLNILSADTVCKATDHVPQMIDMVLKIQQNGYAYQSPHAVYFEIARDKHYGELARLKLKDLEAGKRVEVDPEKKHAYDFVLWFKAVDKYKNHVMQWDSPWGPGFPGWHVECSAMSTYYLGEEFDIHTGGIDHIPVHHTNEIAQTEAATKKRPWVKYWVHGEFLTIGDEKMSKSKGSFIILDDIAAKSYEPLAFRYFCFQTHYRKQLNMTNDGLEAAQNALHKLRNKVLELLYYSDKGEQSAEKYIEAFENAVNDDLNMPQAVAAVWDMLKDEKVNNDKKYDALMGFDRVLGFDLKKIKKAKVPKDIELLVAEREDARRHKHWQEADKLRDVIQTKGYCIDDTPSGPLVKKV